MIKKFNISIIFLFAINLLSLYFFILINNYLGILLVLFSLIVIISKSLNRATKFTKKIDSILVGIFKIFIFILISIIFFIFFVPINFALRKYTMRQFEFARNNGYRYDTEVYDFKRMY